MISLRILVIRKQIDRSFMNTKKIVRSYSNENKESKAFTTNADHQSVVDFYTGKSVFITGGTGFVGKVLIEKLLYATQLDKIYVLIRDKKSIDVETRLEHMFDNPLFSRVKRNDPHAITKLVPIRGDISLPNLGINEKDEKILINNVSVVFHSAATVKFNEPLSVVMNSNFKSTQQILNLCKRMKNIEALVPISTAYTQPHRPVTLEKIYPPPTDLKEVYKFLDEYGDNKKETLKFLKGYPNPYSFVKALTEFYIVKNHENIPTAIVKPAMVSPTIEEPVKGWTNSWYAGASLLHNVGKGWNVITYGDGSVVIDLIPADYVANLIIISAAKLQGSKEVQVYNVASSFENPVNWEKCFKYFTEECIKQEYNEVPYMFHMFSRSRMVVNIVTIILQKIPAHIADFWLKIRGKEPKYVNIISRVISIRNGMDYFTSNSWIFRTDRTRELFSKLSPEDQKLFPCDPTNIIWSEYFKHYCNGFFKYMKPKYTART